MDDVKDRDNVFDDAEADSDGDTGSSEETPAPPAPEPAATSDSDRVNDLMSKWQQDQARANRAEAELARLKSSGTAGGGSKAVTPAVAGGQADEFVEFARDHSRRLLYESEPRMGQYGLEVTAIEGSSVEAMQESLAKHRATFDSIESRVRSNVLAEHGIDPDIGGGSGEKPLDFERMPAEEFEKYVARAKRGL